MTFIVTALLLLAVTVSACTPATRPDSSDSTGSQEAGAANETPPDGSSASTTENQAGESQPATVQVPTAVPPTGRITLWHSWAQSDGDALDAILRDFRERYPTVTVETLFVAKNDLLQSYAQAVIDGSGPDVVLAPNWWLDELNTLGVVAPLTDPNFAATEAAVSPAAADNLRIGDTLYGMPTNYETVALFYNKSIVPETSLPKSLTELAEMAHIDPQYGIGIYANPFHITWGIPAFGASIFDSSGRSTLADSPGTGQYLRLLAQLDELEGSFVDSDYGMLLDRFKKGEYAFFIDGPWAIDDLKQALGDDLGVTVIPAGPDGASSPYLYADAAYLNPNIAPLQVALSALFVEHFVSAQSGAYLAEIAGRLPANPDASLGENSLLAGFAAQAMNATGMPHGVEMDAFWRYGGDMVLRALSGSDDIQSIVNETAALINDESGH